MSLLWLVLLLGACAVAPDLSRGTVTDLHNAEVAFSTSDQPPEQGWRAATLPLWSLEEAARANENGGMVAWVRFRFDGRIAGPEPHALYTEDVAERYIAWLNGANVHRTYAGKDDRVLGWNRPELVVLPTGALRAGQNELILRVDTGVRWFLSVGHVKIGALGVLRDYHRHRHFWRIDGPRAANLILLALTLFTFVLWLARRKSEPELIWLVGIGVLYFVRGMIFYVERPPYDPLLFALVSQTSLFFLPPIAFGFYAEFLQIPNRKQWNLFYFGFGALLAVISIALAAVGLEGRECTVAMLAMAVFSTIYAFRIKTNADNFERLMMLTVISATIGAGIHDLGRQDHLQLWDGPGFYLQPYNGLAIFTAFFILIGRRFLAAVAGVERLNSELEGRVAQAKAALAASEGARRQLEVEKALETERERLMREVHDGIGANLVTALAVAQHENVSPQAISVLRRAVADLKVTVDSLDPLNGDVLALLGNLRHRLEPELLRAGIATEWNVRDCAPLDWLDSSNALQFLRLMQEAVSNAIFHSGTHSIVFECRPHQSGERNGILVAVIDKGSGFDADRPGHQGKGLANMAARAAAISAELEIASTEGGGTAVTLWLPRTR